MTVRQHKSIAVGPMRIARVVLKMALPEGYGDFGHAHGHAGMSGIGFLNGVHRKKANGICEGRRLAAAGLECHLVVGWHRPAHQ